MEVTIERCAGLDVAKDEVVACIRVPEGRRGRRQEVRTFATFSAELERLAEWLGAEGVTHVVMEATGQYWKPIWYVLEDRGFDLNARHVKMVPGRKTDLLTELRQRIPQFSACCGAASSRPPRSGGSGT